MKDGNSGNKIKENYFFKMKIAIIAGGWHFPRHFYDTARELVIPSNYEVDYIAICHREMTENLFQDYQERIKILPQNLIGRLDRILYKDYVNLEYLNNNGWKASLFPNTVGDFNFINQWLDTNPPEYDLYIYLSDDIFLTPEWKNFLLDLESNTLPIFGFDKGKWVEATLSDDWVHIGNCPNPGSKCMRSSTGIFSRSLISTLGRFSLEKINLKRNGQVNNLWNHTDVQEWNQVQRNLQDYLESNNLDSKSFRLSNHYRASKYMIEAERGLLSNSKFHTSSYNSGVKKYIYEK